MGYDGGRKTLLNGDSGLCQPGEDYAIIIHGWQESCDTEWVSLLASSTQFIASFNVFNFSNISPSKPQRFNGLPGRLHYLHGLQ